MYKCINRLIINNKNVYSILKPKSNEQFSTFVKNYSSTVYCGGRNFIKDYKERTAETREIPIEYSSENLFNKISNDNKVLLKNLKSDNPIYLSRLITKVESTREDHQEQSRLIISYLTSKEEEERIKQQQQSTSSSTLSTKSLYKTFRIGISGPPGAGKSTFIEAFGKYLTSIGNRVAVLAIDPSSIRSGGSILGDKTRMSELSVDPNAYIRPSASRGSLGGITKGTSDSIVLCENAGYNIVIVETVGVGQSEVSIDDMVDCFVLLVPPANGDELQGLKKGIVESADMVVVNKADGELLPKATFTVSEYTSAFKLIRPKNENWISKVVSCSSISKQHIDKVWETMQLFKKTMIESGDFKLKRSLQKQTFMKKLIDEELVQLLYHNEQVQKVLPYFEKQVKDCIISPTLASNEIIKVFLNSQINKDK